MSGDSFIHRLDPRTKIAMLIAFTSAALLTVDTVLTIIVFIWLLAMVSLSGAFRHWYRMLWRAAPLIAIIVIFDSLFSHVSWGPVLFSGHFWILRVSVTPGSIVNAVTMGVRFLSILGISALFIMTTRFEDFVAGLRKLHVPYTIAFSLGLALRSTTLLSADIKAIVDAQRSRCMELDAGSILKGIDRLLPLAVPAIVCLIIRSRNISSAMLCRGYGFSPRPSLFSRLKMKAGDWAMITCLLAGIASIAYLSLV